MWRPSLTLSVPNVTQMLHDWSRGDRAGLDKLIPVVEEELRIQAARYLRRERQGHTLQTTDLIQEAYLRLIDAKNVQWQNRAHFFGIAANLMRRILGQCSMKGAFCEAAAPRQDFFFVPLGKPLHITLVHCMTFPSEVLSAFCPRSSMDGS